MCIFCSDTDLYASWLRFKYIFWTGFSKISVGFRVLSFASSGEVESSYGCRYTSELARESSLMFDMYGCSASADASLPTSHM